MTMKALLLSLGPSGLKKKKKKKNICVCVCVGGEELTIGIILFTSVGFQDNLIVSLLISLT